MAFDGNIDQPEFVTAGTNGKAIHFVLDATTETVAVGATVSRAVDINQFSRMSVSFPTVDAAHGGNVVITLQAYSRGLIDYNIDRVTLVPGSTFYPEDYLIQGNVLRIDIENNGAVAFGGAIDIFLQSA
jgi:hypothetical protein